MIGSDLGIEISGRNWKVDLAYAHHFGAAKPRPNRAVLLGGWRTGSRGWSFMLQLYRPGMELDWHQDGYGIHNYVWSWEIWKPKRGGDIEVRGPHKKWWRFHFFDGGVSEHRVTKCEGYRLVFMVQRMKKQEKSDV